VRVVTKAKALFILISVIINEIVKIAGANMRKYVLLFSLMLTTNAGHAADLLGYLTNEEGRYTGATVEDNIKLMDTDKNGFADVLEVRAFLALKHGEGYEKALLDRWELHSHGNSCHAPSVKEEWWTIDKSNARTQ
jgi:hypothetical protein